MEGVLLVILLGGFLGGFEGEEGEVFEEGKEGVFFKVFSELTGGFPDLKFYLGLVEVVESEKSIVDEMRVVLLVLLFVLLDLG